MGLGPELALAEGQLLEARVVGFGIGWPRARCRALGFPPYLCSLSFRAWKAPKTILILLCPHPSDLLTALPAPTSGSALEHRASQGWEELPVTTPGGAPPALPPTLWSRRAPHDHRRQMFPALREVVSVPRRAWVDTSLRAMGPSLLLLLLLLGLEGWGSAGSRPEVLQAPVGGSIQVQCHYRLQDIRAQKVWCRFVPEGCRPLVSSAVDRSAAVESRRTFLTDMGGGLLQVEMVTLQEEDTGEYGCLVKGAAGPQLVHTIALEVLPKVPGPREKEEEEEEEEEEEVEAEEENYGIDTVAKDPFSDPKGSANPWELSQPEKSAPLIWGAVLLLGLLVVVAVLLFVVMAKRKGNRLGVRGQFQSSRVSDTDPSSAAGHAGDSGLVAELPSDVPYVRLHSPPSFDNTTYTNLALEPPAGSAPAPPPPSPPPSPAPLPPKAVTPSKPVTYATVTFPGGDKGGGASSEPTQDPASSPSPPS